MADTSGPAFPMSDAGYPYMGLSMRDYFAGQALIGLLAQETEEWHYVKYEDAALSAYCLADAMLTARERSGGTQCEKREVG